MSHSNAAISFNNSQNLSYYMQYVNSHSILKACEERQLANDLYYNNNEDVIPKLVLPHLRYVVYIAKGFAGYGLPLVDMIQSGNIGLLKAVKKFNPELGFRLVSFAVHWIKSEITDFIIKNWSIVKIATTKSQRKLFFNLKKYKQSQEWMSESEAENLASKLKVSKKDVLSMDGRLSARDSYIDPKIGEDEDQVISTGEVFAEPQLDVAIEYETQDWDRHINDELNAGLAKLDARSRDIIVSRWLLSEKVTLNELAERHRVSAERVRQIELMTLEKLKDLLTHIQP